MQRQEEKADLLVLSIAHQSGLGELGARGKRLLEPCLTRRLLLVIGGTHALELLLPLLLLRRPHMC